jgi:hypothetical protein
MLRRRQRLEADGDDSGTTDFEMAFVDVTGFRCRGSLAQSWTVAFEEMPPVRGFGSSRAEALPARTGGP